MSEFVYIECLEGQEQGPAIENVDPYCMPADEAMPGGETFPDPLPLFTNLPTPFEGEELGVPQDVQPVPRELAETGSVDPLTVTIFAVIVLLAGLATWLTRWKK